MSGGGYTTVLASVNISRKADTVATRRNRLRKNPATRSYVNGDEGLAEIETVTTNSGTGVPASRRHSGSRHQGR